MYEELRKEVNWEHKYPDGEALHAAGFDNLLPDIWESEEHLNNFINYRLLPIMQLFTMTRRLWVMSSFPPRCYYCEVKTLAQSMGTSVIS